MAAALVLGERDRLASQRRADENTLSTPLSERIASGGRPALLKTFVSTAL
ncbi:MAG: hypothetical protein ACFCUN_10325 [Hyphomicrobiaceae bacterium]